VATLFEKLGPPPAEKAPPKEKIEQPIDHLEILLEWLMSRWTKNTITLRDISAYGPYPIRKKEIITNLTQILAARKALGNRPRTSKKRPSSATCAAVLQVRSTTENPNFARAQPQNPTGRPDRNPKTLLDD